MFCLEQGPAVYNILDTVLIYNMALHWCCGVFFLFNFWQNHDFETMLYVLNSLPAGHPRC